MISEELKKVGKYQPSAILGVSTLHAVRTNTFVADVLGVEPECVVVPIIGGNTGSTIVPVLSQAKPCAEFTRVSNVFYFKKYSKTTYFVSKSTRILSFYFSFIEYNQQQMQINNNI